METQTILTPNSGGNKSLNNSTINKRTIDQSGSTRTQSVKSKKDVTRDLNIADVEKELTQTSLATSLAWALCYIGTIPTAAFFALHVFFEINRPIGFTLIVIAMLFIARQQRGLELMIHDASHGTWLRRDRRRNNLLSTLVVGFPCLSSTSEYIKSHFPHHVKFDSELDPCKSRFEGMGLGNIDFSTRYKRIKAVVKWLPDYSVGYYKQIGSITPYIFVGFIIWHFLVFILPIALFLSFYGITENLGSSFLLSAFLWVIFWALPFTGILPILRSIAEAEEHDYDAGDTEFSTTYTNDGLFHHLFFHPWFDSYHQIHHMYPLMPAYNHKKFHNLLMQTSSVYRHSSMHRTEVLKSHNL